MSHTETPPRVLCIGGSECTGVTGLATDMRSVEAFAAHPLPVVTAVTAQHRGGAAVQVIDAATFDSQLACALAAEPAAIKIGLVASLDQARSIARQVGGRKLPVVLDPVSRNSLGQDLVAADHTAILTALLPVATLVTPNEAEAEPIRALRGNAAAGAAPAVLYKGGHAASADCRDHFEQPGLAFTLSGPRIEAAGERGTGCCLAASVAAALALGHSLADAVVVAKMCIDRALRQGYAVTAQGGALRPTPPWEGRPRLPRLDFGERGEQAPTPGRQEAFPDCGPRPLGIYPVVDRAAWLERLLPCGVTTIQLRVKDLAGAALAREVATAVRIARAFDARLFVNDHWRLALDHGAYGVHLGQEDLAGADLPELRRAGLRLGISTHCLWELARALTHQPSYVACGPVYATTSKIMPWRPQGLAGLARWRQLVGRRPLVAIGGIDTRRAAAVAAAGADGVAMISALTGSDNPQDTARALVRQFRRHYR
ncbi:thiamine phosphate synthase [Parahaliea mediterranea]|uniref:thiamine phosphate synthase n=1 Tax=Parahaliea mediterranea TaxID=651086 RepID=UPI00321B882E